MKIKDLMEMLKDGIYPDIQITERARPVISPTYPIISAGTPDPGMRGVLREINPFDEEYGIYHFEVDLKPWDSYNRAMAPRDWLNPDMEKEDVTFFESGYYPKDGIKCITSAVNLEKDGEVEIFELLKGAK